MTEATLIPPKNLSTVIKQTFIEGYAFYNYVTFKVPYLFDINLFVLLSLTPNIGIDEN